MPDDIIGYLNQLDHPAAPVKTDESPKTPFSDLPRLMKTIIDKDMSAEINVDIEKKHGLTQKQGDRMMDVIRKVIFKTIRPAELMSTLQNDLELSPSQARDLAIDLLGRRFLPMEWYLGDIQGVMRQLGSTVEDYLTEAKKNYPEVYEEPHPETLKNAPVTDEHPILRNFDERVKTARGRAEILLRLVGSSGNIEEAMKTGKMSRPDGESFMRQLEAVSYALNTQDLNPFEIQAIKRRLRRLLSQIEG